MVAESLDFFHARSRKELIFGLMANNWKFSGKSYLSVEGKMNYLW